MKGFASLHFLPMLLTGANAHYKWTSLILNGATTPDYEYVRSNTNSIDPITDITSLDFRCNAGGLASGGRTKTASVRAGDKIGLQLSNVISHVGPVQVYLAHSPGDPSSFSGTGAVWFKVAYWGPNFSSSIQWPQLGASKYEFTIPPATPNGNYLLRIEQIALHSASMTGGAQFYIACAQIQVSGGGNGSPGPKIEIPGGYSQNDAGILFNNYYPAPTSYTPPGPQVWYQ